VKASLRAASRSISEAFALDPERMTASWLRVGSAVTETNSISYSGGTILA
jgi:hypothetical protein